MASYSKLILIVISFSERKILHALAQTAIMIIIRPTRNSAFFGVGARIIECKRVVVLIIEFRRIIILLEHTMKKIALDRISNSLVRIWTLLRTTFTLFIVADSTSGFIRVRRSCSARNYTRCEIIDSGGGGSYHKNLLT